MAEFGYGTIVRRETGELFMLVSPNGDKGWWNAVLLNRENGKVVDYFAEGPMIDIFLPRESRVSVYTPLEY